MDTAGPRLYWNDTTRPGGTRLPPVVTVVGAPSSRPLPKPAI